MGWEFQNGKRCQNVPKIQRMSFEPSSNDSCTLRVYSFRMQLKCSWNIVGKHQNAARMQLEYVDVHVLRMPYDLGLTAVRILPDVLFECTLNITRMQYEYTSNTFQKLQEQTRNLFRTSPNISKMQLKYLEYNSTPLRMLHEYPECTQITVNYQNEWSRIGYKGLQNLPF